MIHEPLPPTTPVVIAARRTPIGTAGRSLRALSVTELAAPVLTALADDLRALGLDPIPDDVILGNTRGPGGNIARVAGLLAGLGWSVPAMTVDRQCGSGQAAIHVAADAIASGRQQLVLAGGAESASTQPITGSPGEHGATYERAPFSPSIIGDPDMGPAAQLVADEAGISRARQDEYAARSHRRSLASIASGQEADEVVPLAGLAQDERPRAITPATLARLPGVFGGSGTITAGNSCGVSDAAAVLALVPESRRAALGVPGLALRAWVEVGCDPNRPGLGPVPAVAAALAAAGLGLGAIDRFELTEAFAGQVLACTDALGLDPLGADDPRWCPDGGAIARGHPWGASGAVLVVSLYRALVRQQRGRLGVAACAVGGGQGLALVCERVG